MLIPQKMVRSVFRYVCERMWWARGNSKKRKEGTQTHTRAHARSHAVQETDMQLTFLNGVSKLYVTTTLTTTRRWTSRTWRTNATRKRQNRACCSQSSRRNGLQHVYYYDTCGIEINKKEKEYQQNEIFFRINRTKRTHTRTRTPPKKKSEIKNAAKPKNVQILL